MSTKVLTIIVMVRTHLIQCELATPSDCQYDTPENNLPLQTQTETVFAIIAATSLTTDNSNTNNTNDSVYSAVNMAEPLQEFTQFTRRIQHGAMSPTTFGPSQLASATGPPI